jgi:hypothetical protein
MPSQNPAASSRCSARVAKGVPEMGRTLSAPAAVSLRSAVPASPAYWTMSGRLERSAYFPLTRAETLNSALSRRSAASSGRASTGMTVQSRPSCRLTNVMCSRPTAGSTETLCLPERSVSSVTRSPVIRVTWCRTDPADPVDPAALPCTAESAGPVPCAAPGVAVRPASSAARAAAATYCGRGVRTRSRHLLFICLMGGSVVPPPVGVSTFRCRADAKSPLRHGASGTKANKAAKNIDA